jgi:hypothetical protein
MTYLSAPHSHRYPDPLDLYRRANIGFESTSGHTILPMTRDGVSHEDYCASCLIASVKVVYNFSKNFFSFITADTYAGPEGDLENQMGRRVPFS